MSKYKVFFKKNVLIHLLILLVLIIYFAYFDIYNVIFYTYLVAILVLSFILGFKNSLNVFHLSLGLTRKDGINKNMKEYFILLSYFTLYFALIKLFIYIKMKEKIFSIDTLVTLLLIFFYTFNSNILGMNIKKNIRNVLIAVFSMVILIASFILYLYSMYLPFAIVLTLGSIIAYILNIKTYFLRKV